MTMDNQLLNTLYKTYKAPALSGRYINLNMIKPLLDNLPTSYNVEVIGQSVLGEDILSLTIGTGPIKVLMWSQMHGNESTTTKAVFDMINSFSSVEMQSILKACTLKIIPMLNPDGSAAYTRLNANNIDLNRDAQDLSQPESKVLSACFNNFNPDYCLNLHGQRTLFSVGDTNKPATLSFLSPSQDELRSVTSTRLKAMNVISAINTGLQTDLANQIGRYDDGFNINCVGDTFQSLNAPTILFEAGHYKDDYNREVVRGFVYKALLQALNYIANDNDLGYKMEDYFKIPENGKRFYDIIIRNAKYNDQVQDIGINYLEQLIDNKVKFRPKVVTISDLSQFYGHKEMDANNNVVLNNDNTLISMDYENDFVIVNNVKLSLNL
ncbi:M14 family zinc carboxypeptidase [Olleya marilimosa]|uniref:M14 family zinc carboxypeptidase n=1 Tax=Olleya marilimosa TaxID=272164 RepID=UPI00048498BD|nr:M14 family zinc carboxypeptidase [Olleya marilimosa]